MKKIIFLFLSLFSIAGYSQFPTPGTEGFEGTTGPDALPSTNWSLGTGATSNQWAVFDNGTGLAKRWTITTVAANVYAGTNAAFMDRENIGAGNTSEDYLATPLVTVPANGQLRFWTRSTLNGPNGTDYLIKINTNTTAGSQTTVANYNIAPVVAQWTEATLNTTFNVYEEKVIDLTAYAGQQVYIAFVMKFTQPTAGLGGDRWLIDDVKLVERCIEPTGLSATNISQTTAELSWTSPGGATSWEVEVLPSTNIPTGTGVIYNGALPYVATGLTPTTAYVYYVRSVCANSISTWVGPFNFTTSSPGLSCTAPIAITSLPYSTTDDTGNYGDSTDTAQPTACAGGGTNYMTGNDVFYSYTPSTTGIISISMTPNGNWSGIFVYQGCPNVGVTCVAGVANTGNGVRSIPNLNVTAGLPYIIVISTNSTPQTVGYNLVIQTVNCAQPTNLAAIPTQNTAQLSWDNPGGATSWEVTVQPNNTGIPSGAGTQTNNNINYIQTGLSPDTAYEFWVRADCGNGTFSAWAGPYAFNTQIVPPTCGGIYTDIGGASANYPNNTDSTVTICPTVLGEVVTVTFTSFDTEATWDGLYVFDGNSVFSNLLASTNGAGNVPGGLAGSYWGTAIPGPFTSTSPDGCLTFRFVSDGFVNNPGYTANVTCGLPPTCPMPNTLTATAVTSNSTVVGWVNTSTATTWNILALPCGSTPPTAASTGFAVATSNPFTLTGLNPDTCYDIYVRGVCPGNDLSDWAGPRTITTQIAPPVCGGIFTDPAGASVNYANNTDNTVTICPTNSSELVTVTFTDFNTETNWDALYVFDGNSIAAPLISSGNGAGNVPGGLAGGFWGTTIPGPFTSSLPGGCLTFRFRSDGSVTNPGWIANVTCDPIPTCPKPVQLTVTNVTQTSATLSWTEIGTATAWQILVVPLGSPVPTSTTLGIATTNPYIVTNLPPGTAYTFYVRSVCSPTDIGPWSGPKTFGTLPVNDECVNATFAIVNQNLNCVQTTPGTLVGATQSLPNVNCPPGVANDDVWFTFTATAATHIISFNNVTPATTTMNYAIFSGSDCGNLTQVACNSGAGLTAGVTYFIRVYSAQSTPQFTTFNLCIGTLPCTEAPAFCTGQTVTYANSTNVPSLGQIGCLFTSPNPAFFFLQVNQAGALSYLISQIDNNGIPRDVDYVAWGPFTDLNTACSGVPANPLPGATPIPTPASGCPGTLHACSYSAAPQEIMCIPNAQLCEVYVIMITNFSNQAGQVTFTQTNNGEGTTSCFPINTFNYQLNTYCQDGVDPTPTLAPGASAGTYTAVPAGLAIDSTTGTIDLSASLPGAYVVTSTTLTSTNGVCTNIPTITTTRTVIITAPANATISYANPAYCNNITTIQTAVRTGTTGGSYSSTPSGLSIDSITGNIAPSASIPGIYTVTYTVAANGGCAAFSTTTPVTIIATPLIAQPANISVCGSYTLPVLTTGNYFTGINGTGTQIPAGTVITTNQTIYIYAESGTVPNCTDEKSFTITITPNVTPTFSTIGSICQNTTAPALPTSSIENVTGTWNPSSIDTSTLGTFTYTFTPDANQCAAVITISVTISTPLTPAFAPIASICQNTTAPALPTTSTNGVTGTWSPQTIDTSVAGSDNYIFTPDAGQCAVSTTITVTINALVTPLFTQLPAVCQGGTAAALPTTSTNGIVGTWNPATIYTTAAGTVTAIFTPNAGICASTASMSVTIHPTPVVNAIADVDACNSYTLPTLASGNYFTGANGTGTQLAAGTSVTSTQTIYVYAQSGTTPNCSAQQSFDVTITPTPLFTIEGGCQGSVYVLEVIATNFNGTAATYSWSGPSGSIGTNSPTLQVATSTPGVYSCTVTIPNGNSSCSDTKSFTANDVTCTIQKGISPNGDGLNETFDLTGFNVKTLSIYNRYGTKVYTRNNYVNEWGGLSDKGNELPDGTYYYIIERDAAETKSGWIYINRQNK